MRDKDYCERHRSALPCAMCNTKDGRVDLPLFAHARNSDPETSHQAAASIPSAAIRESQEMVLEALRGYGPMPDFHLVPLLASRMSPSGIRSRRSELVTLGKVVDTGKRVRTDSGRQAIVWAAL